MRPFFIANPGAPLPTKPRLPYPPCKPGTRNVEPETNDDGGMMVIVFLAFALSGGLVGCCFGWIARGLW